MDTARGRLWNPLLRWVWAHFQGCKAPRVPCVKLYVRGCFYNEGMRNRHSQWVLWAVRLPETLPASTSCRHEWGMDPCRGEQLCLPGELECAARGDHWAPRSCPRALLGSVARTLHATIRARPGRLGLFCLTAGSACSALRLPDECSALSFLCPPSLQMRFSWFWCFFFTFLCFFKYFVEV